MNSATLLLNGLFESCHEAYVRSNPNAQAQLMTLAGFVYQINLSGLDISRYLIADNHTIQVLHSYQGEVDVVITGPPLSLLKLGKATEAQKLDDVHISGNINAITALNLYVKQLSIDWEALMAKIMGDVPAHQLSRFIRHQQKTIDSIANNFQKDNIEYLMEEARLIINPFEMRTLIDEVDNLVDSVARLEARMQRLKKRML